MKAASVTDTAMSQGLKRGFQPAPAACGVAHGADVTVGSTEMPSGSGNIRIEAAVDDDLDRHALHDLDEIAGRVLGGKAVNLEPEPSWMLSTWPLQVECG